MGRKEAEEETKKREDERQRRDSEVEHRTAMSFSHAGEMLVKIYM